MKYKSKTNNQRYWKPFWTRRKLLEISKGYSNKYSGNEDNGDRNKALLIKEYLDEIKPDLKGIINILKKSNTWNSINNWN